MTLVEVKAVEERGFDAWSAGFCANMVEFRSLLIHYSGNDEFRPDQMSAASLLGLMQSLRGQSIPQTDGVEAA